MNDSGENPQVKSDTPIQEGTTEPSQIDPLRAVEEAGRELARLYGNDDGDSSDQRGNEANDAENSSTHRVPASDAAIDPDTAEDEPVEGADAEDASAANADAPNPSPSDTTPEDAAAAAAEALASLSDLSDIGELVVAGPLDTQDEAGGNDAASAEDADGADNAAKADSEAQRERASAASASANAHDETVMLPGKTFESSLTTELPGRGSAPVVDETVPMRSASTLPHAGEHPGDDIVIKKHHNPRKVAAVAVACAAVVAVGGWGIYQWWSGQQATQQEEAQSDLALYDVPVPLKISGLTIADDGTTTGSRIPIQVSGQDANGNIVDMVGYVDANGNGLKLMRGEYTLSAAASPIAADGTIYAVPQKKLDITVKGEGGDYRSAGTLSFTVPAAYMVKDAEINNAYEYASKGGVSSERLAQVLKAAATDRRDAALTASKQQTTVLIQEANARHKATPSYAFDIPQAWSGKVVTSQNGNTVLVHLASNRNIIVCRLDVEKNGFAGGDVNNEVLGSKDLGNGTSVVVRGAVYPWVVPQTVLGKAGKSIDAYSMDEAVALVELQTGNRYTYDQVKNELGGSHFSQQDATKMVQDHIGQALVSSIKAS